MSTNKTENYSLHAWEPGDDFLRAEINENFAKLDAALPTRLDAVMGRYVGDDTDNRAIVLGKKPFAVLIDRYNGARGTDTYCYGGIYFPDVGSAVKCTDDGFVISSHFSMNLKKVSMYYMAFFKETPPEPSQEE